MRLLFLCGIFAILLALSLSWLLTNDLSPLSDFLLWHPQMRNNWAMLNFPSYLAGTLAARNPHNTNNFVFWTFFLIQWFLTGVVLAMVSKAFFKRRQSQNSEIYLTALL